MSFRRKSYLIFIHLFFGLIAAVLFACVFGIFVKLLWGLTISPIFGLPVISYWQGMGLVLLARLLFGGFGSGHTGHTARKPNKKEDSEGVSEKNEAASTQTKLDVDLKKHYKKFWEEEGEQAFNTYVKNAIDS